MKVYYMNVKSIKADDEKWFKYLSQKRIEKVNRLKKTNKKSQSIGAELLLNYAVNGDIKKTVEWDTENGGKLYLTQNRDLYVNLSHSGGYAVCAVHNKDVGIDIQGKRIRFQCFIKLAQTALNQSQDRKKQCILCVFRFQLQSLKQKFLCFGKTVFLNTFNGSLGQLLISLCKGNSRKTKK